VTRKAFRDVKVVDKTTAILGRKSEIEPDGLLWGPARLQSGGLALRSGCHFHFANQGHGVKPVTLRIEHVHMSGRDENSVTKSDVEVKRGVADELELDSVVTVD